MLAQVSPSIVVDWEGCIEVFIAPDLCKGAPAIERVLAEDQFAAPPLEEYRPMVESRQDPTDESPGSSPQSSNSAGASPYLIIQGPRLAFVPHFLQNLPSRTQLPQSSQNTIDACGGGVGCGACADGMGAGVG